MDIHLHTPASADWLEPGTSYLQWLQKAESRGLDIVAITDHNTVEGVARLRAEIERLAWLEANDRLRPQERRDLDEYRRLGDKILVLPGFEFTATFGFHILGIFSPETSLRKLELLLLRLNVPMDRLADGITEVGPTTDVLTAYRMIREAGGLVIAAHANSTHGVALQGMSFGGQTRIAFTQDANLHALEVTDLESASRRSSLRFFDGSKPEYPRRMHLLQGSDAHRLARDPKDKNRLGVGDRVTEILLNDVSFEALRTVLESNDFTLMRPYRPPAEAPFDYVQAAREQGPTIVQAFHESMARDGGNLSKVLCDVVAFANTCGGTIYVGVSADKAPVKGVDTPDLAVQQIKKEIERNITPPLECQVDIMHSQATPVLRVQTPNGPDKPYALGQTRIYIREEGDTTEAVRDELVQLVLQGRRLVEGPHAPAEAVPAPVLEPVQEESQAARPAQRRPSRQKPAERAPAPSPVAAAEPGPEPEREEEAVALPSIGVELVSMEERKGGRYFAIRDMRNGNVVQNVTIHSARKLWSYAINQHLTHLNGPEDVTWRGDLGLWQAARRAKRLRYDLVLRMPDGRVRVFYGVTADGMTGPWAQFLLGEDRPEGESEATAPSVIIAEESEEEEAPEALEPGDILAPPENGDKPSEDTAAKAKSRRGRRGGRGRGKGKSAEAAPESAEAASDGLESPTEGETPAVEVETPVLPQLESEPAPVLATEPVAVAQEAAPKKPARPTRKPKPQPTEPGEVAVKPQLQELATMVDAVVAAPRPVAAVASETAPKPRRTRAKKQQPEQPLPVESSEVAVLEAPVVESATNGSEAASASNPPRPRKPKAEQVDAARGMPDAIGHAPKRRPRKPKEVTE